MTSKGKTGPSECRRGAFASNGGVDGGDRGGKQDMKLEGLASALEEVSTPSEIVEQSSHHIAHQSITNHVSLKRAQV